MAVNSFNSLLRMVCSSFYNENKEMKEVKSIVGYVLNEQAQGLLVSLVKLCMETDYFKPDTKEYLTNKYKTIRTVSGVDGCANNKHTSRSRINYDLSKLRAVLGEGSLDIIIKQPHADLTSYISKINELLKKHEHKSLLDNLTIKYPKTDDICREFDKDSIFTLLRIARFQSKKGRMIDENELTSDMVAYVNYLENNKDSLQGDDLEIYQTLCEWLG